MNHFKVDEDNHDLRLDVFLTNQLPESPSRSFIKRLIEEGKVRVNNNQVKAGFKVSAGDDVAVEDFKQGTCEIKVLPENIPLDIFYEDDCLLIVNKPVGMLVHPTHSCQTGTLVNALLHHYKQLSDVHLQGKGDVSDFRPGIVHRLDRETSGLMIVVKENRSHVRLARQFKKHRINKRYVALVQGEVEFDEGVIDAPIDRDAAHWDKKAISFNEEAKDSKTFYRVLQRLGGKKTLVALFPRSGRTHQLRVHMKHLGHPILGDEKYGVKGSYPRMFLHAQSIGFEHPESRHNIEFFSPLPKGFLA